MELFSSSGPFSKRGRYMEKVVPDSYERNIAICEWLDEQQKLLHAHLLTQYNGFTAVAPYEDSLIIETINMLCSIIREKYDDEAMAERIEKEWNRD